MSFPSPQRRLPLGTPTAQFEIKSPVNRLCRGRHEGLDDETKTSDFPVEGVLFLLTSPFIELPHGGAWAVKLYHSSRHSVQQAQTPQEVKILSTVISGVDNRGK